jgi:predicted nucleic acid-binding protein
MTPSSERIFLDACVLFAGSHSPAGASGCIMDLGVDGEFEVAVSRIVIEEALRALRSKSGARAVARFFEFVANPRIRIGEAPSPAEIDRFSRVLPPKDRHVLASAVAIGSDFLVTLDRAHFFTPTIVEAKLPLKIVAPGDLLGAWRNRQEERSE